MIGLLVGTATLALAATAFADATVETIPPAPAPVDAPAAEPLPVTAPPPVAGLPPAAEAPPPEAPQPGAPPADAPPADAAPAEAPPAVAPAATEVLPQSQPAEAAPLSPAIQRAAAPRAGGERRTLPTGAPPEDGAQGEGAGETEPDCVVTGPDGSCALESTDCDILGDDGDNELFGTPDGEIICGLGGDDLLDGRGGRDMLVGGPGADRYTRHGEDCVIPADEDVEATDLVKLCVFNNGRYFNLQPPPTDTGGGGGGGGGGGSPGDVASVGALYVALTRYASAQASGNSAEAIALIATRAVRYSRGEISFLVTCSRAGEVRVTLAALRRNGSPARLGTTTFRCQGDGDDQTVTVRLADAGRRLVEGSTRVRIRAQLVEAGATGATRQNFVLPQ